MEDKTKSFSIEEALRWGWKTTQDNLGFFIVLLVIVFAANLVPAFLADSVKESSTLLAFMFKLLGWALGVVVSLGLVRIVLDFVDGKKPEFEELFLVYPMVLRYLSASAVYGLIVFVGFLLFIVPGLIWLIKYSMFAYLMVDKDMGALESLSASGKLTKGARLTLFWFGIIFGVVNLLGVLAFGVGLFITIPVTSLAAAHVYKQLLAKSKI